MKDFQKGQVIKNISGKTTVYSEGVFFDCIIRGKIKNQKIKVLVGDYCLFDKNAKSIEEILPRNNTLVRPPVANINQLIVFVSIEPEPDYALIDKLIISADMNDIDTILLINKDDLIDNEFLIDISSQYKNVVKNIIVTGSVTKNSISEIKNKLAGKFTAFVGQSGVGKSSILNTLFPNLSLEVGELSLKNSKGKHTTRHSEIYLLENGGAVIDTPGFNLFDFKDINANKLSDLYSDISVFAKHCKYRSCNHVDDNLQDCGVISAIKSGDLNKKRYNRYKELYNYIKSENEKKYV